MRRFPYCGTPALTGDYPYGSVPRKANNRIAEPHSWERRRSPAVLLVFPAPDRVPHACPERPENETIASRVRREAIDGWRCASDKSRLDAVRLEADKSWLLGS